MTIATSVGGYWQCKQQQSSSQSVSLGRKGKVGLLYSPTSLIQPPRLPLSPLTQSAFTAIASSTLRVLTISTDKLTITLTIYSPPSFLLPPTMSLFDYQPGELSLLLNPTAKPDVYHYTAPTAVKGNKRPIDSAEQHDRQPIKKKKTDRSQPTEHIDQHNTNSQQHHTRSKRQTDSETTVDGETDTSTIEDELDEAEDESEEMSGQQAGSDDGDEEGELSDLSDLDDSELYADMDASTARQLRKQKRVLEDQQLEQQSTNNKAKARPNTAPSSDPRLPRTLFVGNVPTTASRQQLARFFKQFGTVESCRLRSFSVSNPKLTKRVAMIKGAIHPNSQSMNAYIVFDSEQSVEAAVAKNGTVEYEGHKLRLDYADGSKSTATPVRPGVAAGLSVFVGNLPFSVSEQQLYDVFDGCGAISGVRVVRDPLLALGKGFAFVTFREPAAVKKALAMQGVAIDGRELRLTKAMDETKAREVRDQRRKDMQPATTGAARRLQDKVKHAERKNAAAAAAAVAGRGEKKGKVYVGEVSNPMEYVQKARRVEKKQKMKKEERRKKRSLVKVKKVRMKKPADAGTAAAVSQKTGTKRKDNS